MSTMWGGSMKTLTPREQWESTLNVLQTIQSVAKESDMSVEHIVMLTISIYKAQLKEPQLELVTTDD